MISGMTGLLIIVAVMLIVIIRRQLRERAARGGEALVTAAEELTAQMEEAADRIVKRMENHVNHLELLIAEADERIAQLDEKIRRAETLGQAPEPVKLPLAAEQGASRRAAVPADCGASGLFSGAASERRARPPAKPSGVRAQVAAMLEDGRPIDAIARETGLGKSAILLIQEMRQAKKKNES